MSTVRPARRVSSLLRSLLALIDAVRVLWVSGLALSLVVLIGALLGHTDAVRLKHVQYAALGTLFPAVAMTVAALPRLTRGTRVPRTVEGLLALFGLLMAGRFLVRHLNAPVIAVSIIHGVAAWAVTLLRARRRPQASPDKGRIVAPDAAEERSSADLPFLVLLVLVTLVSWTAWIQVLPGGRIEDAWISASAFGTTFEGWFSRSAFSLPIFVLSLIIVVATLTGVRASSASSSDSSRIARYCGNLIALSLFGMAAFRTDQLFKDYGQAFDTFLHWSYFVSAGDAVRHGNWLLWDVPSVYGFLGIATLAVVPTQDVWESLYLVNACLVLLSAITLFFLFRSLRSGALSWCFALGLTFAVVFVLPGNLDLLTGPQIWPSVGGFRFCWAYLLLAVILIAHRSHPRHRVAILVLGCIIWLVGTLWSFESAVYCTAIWFPAYVLMVWLNAGLDARRQRLVKAIGRVASWIGLPILLLALTVCGVMGCYRVVLGHPPDYRAFVEMAVQWNKRYAIEWNFDDVGSVALFILFCVTSTACIEWGRHARTRALGLICGAWVTLWAGSSYFVAKTDRVTLFLVAPAICCSIAVTAYVYRRHDRDSRGLGTLIRSAYVPVLTVLLAAGLGNPGTLVRAAYGWGAGYPEFRGRLPALDESAVELLRSARDKIDCPVVFLENPLVRVREVGGNDCSSGSRGEPPLASWLLAVDVLAPERVDVYVSRYMARRSWKGYVLVTKDSKRGSKSPARIGMAQSDFLYQLVRRGVATRVAENADYELARVEMGQANSDTP